MGNIKDFVQGEFNKTLEEFNLLSENIKNQADERQDICKVCQFLDKKEAKCTKCGCKFPDLTFAPDKECPMKYWKKMEK